MKAIGLVLAASLMGAGQAPEDRRVEQPKGYHIVSHPARTGETPPEIKQEKAEEDYNRRRQNSTDISDRTPPTRDPVLRPKEIKP